MQLTLAGDGVHASLTRGIGDLSYSMAGCGQLCSFSSRCAPLPSESGGGPPQGRTKRGSPVAHTHTLVPRPSERDFSKHKHHVEGPYVYVVLWAPTYRGQWPYGEPISTICVQLRRADRFLGMGTCRAGFSADNSAQREDSAVQLMLDKLGPFEISGLELENQNSKSGGPKGGPVNLAQSPPPAPRLAFAYSPCMVSKCGRLSS